MISAFRELWQFRDLFFVLIWREITIRYKHSVLGILWAVIQPISMMTVFVIIFTKIMPVTLSAHPYPLFFYAALLPWTFFSTSLNYATPVLVDNYHLITKISFPRALLPLTCLAVALVDLLISLVFFFILLIIYNIPVSAFMLWLFPLMGLLFLFTFGTSLVVSSLNVYYRDVRHVTTLLIQLMFFATPIFYSTVAIQPPYRYLLFANPLTFIVEGLRTCTLDQKAIPSGEMAGATVIIMIFVVASWLFFKRMERRFADVI